MQTLKSMYRILVMGTTLAIVVMGWRLYGPSAAQCKTIALRGLDFVQTQLQPVQEQKGKQPERAPTALQPVVPMAAPISAVTSPPLLAVRPVANDGPSKSDLLGDSGGGAIAIADEYSPSGLPVEDFALKAMLTRYTELDIKDPKLAPWGASGQLYRFCCRATWGESPHFSRHFESVAPEPAKAIEQVLTQVSVWRQGAPATR